MAIRTNVRLGSAAAMAAIAVLAFAAPAYAGPQDDSVSADVTITSGRYMSRSVGEDGVTYGKFVLDLKDRDFTVCDKKKGDGKVYVSFQNEVHMEHPKPYYWDNVSGSGCSHYYGAPKKNQIAICRSDAFWDTCSEYGITWQ